MLAVFSESLTTVSSLLKQVTVKNTWSMGKCHVLLVAYQCKKFLIVETGYAKVNIGAATGFAMKMFHIDRMIGVGNCGCTQKVPENMIKIAVSRASLQYDVDFEAIGYPVPLIVGLQQARYFADEMLIHAAHGAAAALGYPCFDAAFGTADRFVADTRFCRDLRCRFDIDCVDNECGNIGEISVIHNLPYVFVKGVSNFADNDAGAMYHANKAEANRRACDVVCAMLEALLTEEDSQEADEPAVEPEKKPEKPEKCHCNEHNEHHCDMELFNWKKLDAQEIVRILENNWYAMLGVSEENQPYVLPMCYRFLRGKSRPVLQMHTMPGKKMRCIRTNSQVCATVMQPVRGGMASVVMFGTAEIVRRDACTNCNGGDMYTMEIVLSKISGRFYPEKENTVNDTKA